MHDGSLKSGALRPGAQVSIDHFESRLLGQTLILMVGLLQISLLVDVFLLIIPLFSCMLSIKLSFLLSRLLEQNRTMKV